MGCKIKTNNTAESRCKKEMGLYRRVIITPMSAVYTGANDQTIEEWIEDGIHAEKDEERFYPMPLFTDCEDNSEDNVEWTNGYGTSMVIREGAFAFTQKFERDVCLTRRLLDFNAQTFRALIVDNENNIQGITTAEGFKGETCKIWVSQPKANSASEFSEPSIKYSFTNPDEHKLRDIESCELPYGEMKGLEEVEIVATGNKIKFMLPCGNIDVTAEFTALTAACWISNGTAMSSAPVYDATNNAFTAVSAMANKTLTLATPDVLFDAGVANKVCINTITLGAIS